jgi:hypothetical protein
MKHSDYPDTFFREYLEHTSSRVRSMRIRRNDARSACLQGRGIANYFEPPYFR